MAPTSSNTDSASVEISNSSQLQGSPSATLSTLPENGCYMLWGRCPSFQDKGIVLAWGFPEVTGVVLAFADAEWPLVQCLNPQGQWSLVFCLEEQKLPQSQLGRPNAHRPLCPGANSLEDTVLIMRREQRCSGGPHASSLHLFFSGNTSLQSLSQCEKQEICTE